MPEQQTTPAPISPAIKSWIAAFYAAKSWRVTAPEPGTHGPAAPDVAAQAASVLAAYDQQHPRADIEQALQDARAQAEAARAALADAPDEAARAAAEAALAQAGDREAEAREELAQFDRLRARLAQLEEEAVWVGDDLAGIGAEIARLHQARDTAPQTASLDPAAVNRFRGQHDLVSANVETASREQIPAPRGSAAPTVPLLSSDEHRLLVALLELSLLRLESGDLDGAGESLRSAEVRLADFRTTNMGLTPITQAATGAGAMSPELEGFASDIEAIEDELRKKGYTGAAGRLAAGAAQLRLKVEADTTATATYRPYFEKLREAGGTMLERVDAIEKHVAAARGLVSELLLNGDDAAAARADQRIAEFDRSQPLDLATKAVVQMVEAIRRDLTLSLEEVLAAEGEARSELLRNLNDISNRYDRLFKHDASGAVKTKKDHDTGGTKEVKKDRSLPRTALREVDLRIGAGRELLDSGSVEAEALAGQYLASVDRFLSRIEDDPKFFKRIEERFATFEKQMKAVEADFKLYEVGERNDINEKLADLKGNYVTRDPDEVEKALDDLDARQKALRETCVTLRARKRALQKTADRVEKLMATVGAKLVAGYSTSFHPLTAYHGACETDLAEAREKIARRSEASLEDAGARLSDTEGKLIRMLGLMQLDARNAMQPEQALSLRAFIGDARKGQAEHDRHANCKTDFNSGIKTLLSDLAKLRKKLLGLHSDPADCDALKIRAEALQKEMAGSQLYADGLPQLQTLQHDFARLTGEADTLRAEKDLGVEAAAQACRDAVRALHGYIAGFVQAVVVPAGASDAGNDLDGFDRGKIDAYMQGLAGAIPLGAADDLPAKARQVADATADMAARKAARKAALADVRALSAVFNGFRPMRHFRAQPFADDAPFGALNRTLPQLEVKLLTALG